MAMKMKEVENEALQYLANIQDDQFIHYSFRPYKSILMERKDNTKAVLKRPVTVQSKKGRQFEPQSYSKREVLKNQLRILEEPLLDDQNRETKITRTRLVTTTSTNNNKPTCYTTHHNLFPTQPIKKYTPNRKMEYYYAKQNDLKIQDLVRKDIKNKFSIRETLREIHKTKKLQNFINVTCQLRKSSNNNNKSNSNRYQIKQMVRKNNLINLLS